jgi:hypothetical protein
VEKNLFREVDPTIALIGGFSPRLLAFQEDDAGQITGMVIDGLPFMSLRKLPVYETPVFNFALLGFALLMFLGVLLRRFYSARPFAACSRPLWQKRGWAAAANWLVLIRRHRDHDRGDQMFSAFPAVQLWLVLPSWPSWPASGCCAAPGRMAARIAGGTWAGSATASSPQRTVYVLVLLMRNILVPVPLKAGDGNREQVRGAGS